VKKNLIFGLKSVNREVKLPKVEFKIFSSVFAMSCFYCGFLGYNSVSF